jgi:hypothetical protein
MSVRRDALRLGLLASAAALVGRGTARAADALTIDSNGAKITNLDVAGSMKIDGSNTLEFGAGVNGKQVDAGKIGYQTFTTDALDIVGAGNAGTNRKIKFWAEGGATFNGSLNVSGNLSVPGGEEALRMLRGIVNGDGTTFSGAGFSVRRVDNGLYDIAFAQGFPSVPGATATQVFGALHSGNAAATATGSTKPSDTAIIVHLSADRMRVGTWTPSGRDNRAFSFIVIGPR